ncbi:hypothetical protein G7068_00025 [Leucobacter viscericola]|uniref:Uncharacterized protein n=1 Tax=Leucobacter viscericola TaxID=2714935 RepID=A0A6G7XB93_9MICO|nr:hypothetical protein [Leucobacter viscericola]QIK61772.1 hypothetical protein G7068_00025 [Leucobacter viscericola]
MSAEREGKARALGEARVVVGWDDRRHRNADLPNEMWHSLGGVVLGIATAAAAFQLWPEEKESWSLSETTSTRSVEIELRVTDKGQVEAYVCDAQVSQWEEGMGLLSNLDREEFAEELESLISLNAQELAESLVKDLFERVMPKMEGKK